MAHYFNPGYPLLHYHREYQLRKRHEEEARALRAAREEAQHRLNRLDDDYRRATAGKPLRFTLRSEHLALLRAAYVDWDNGAPAINAKRPYGNSGHVGRDVARILGWAWPGEEEGEEGFDAMLEHGAILHRETEEALQIVLLFGPDATPGEYERADRYNCRSWRKVAA